MEFFRSRIRQFAVRGVFWRHYLDWALLNVPFYFQPCLLFFWTAFFFLFAADIRRATLANLKTIRPGRSEVVNYACAFRVFWNFAWTITDACCYKLTKADFEYELEGAAFIEELARSSGAIVLTAHMGNYDLGAALFAQKFNRQLRMVRAPEPDTETARHLSASLGASADGAVKIAYNTEGTLLSFDLLGALRQGEIVSIQGDRVMGNVSTSRCRFFAQLINFPDGPFILSLVANVPIYPLFIVREGYRSYRIIVRPAIVCRRTTHSRDAAVSAALDEWCRVLEETVRTYWDQWYAFVPLFELDSHE